MSRRLEILAEAAAEAFEARVWYADRNEAVAADFMRELDRVIAAIAAQPERWPANRRGVRRHLAVGFPFSVVYTVDESCVRVIAVAHAKRRPGYWSKRT